LKSLPKAALEATITLDAQDGRDSWGHAVFQSKLVKETLYVRLEDFEAKGKWAAYIDMVKPHEDVWYSFPVDPKEYEQLMKEQKKGRATSYKEIEGFFDIVKQELRGGKTRYTMTIPKNKQRRLLSRVLGPSYGRTYSKASIDARMSIDTLQNVFDAFTASLDVSATAYGEKTSIKLTGSANVLRTPPIITAPAESTPFQDLVNEQYNSYDNDDFRTLEDARNAQRKSDVNTILNAVYQYAIDNNGNLPFDIPADKTVAICKTRTPCSGASLDALLDSYVVSVPADPSQDADALSTGYTVREGSNGRIMISAPMAEEGATISVER
jgi:type IV pilus assembly protein PilA